MIRATRMDPGAAGGTVTSYPNPFHPASGPTIVAYKIDDNALVTVRVFTHSGDLVRRCERSITVNEPVPLPPSNFTLSVAKTGSGSGTVTDDKGKINCGSTCSGTYVNGTPVSLSAAASPGSTFIAWSGDCSGAAGCVVTMDRARSVTAQFDALPSPPPKVTLKLDVHAAAAKDADETIEQTADAVPAAVERGPADHRHQAGGAAIELLERERALAFRRVELHLRDQAAEIPIAVRAFAEDGKNKVRT